LLYNNTSRRGTSGLSGLDVPISYYLPCLLKHMFKMMD